MNNRTEQLIQLISKVHSMYLGSKIFGVHKALSSEFSMENSRKRFEACHFLSIWLVKLDGTAQAELLALHKYSPSYLQRAGYKKCTPVLRCDHLLSSTTAIIY